MKTITQQFLDKVESAIETLDMDPTCFGRDAMNDPNFVFDLRKGRAASSKTMDRVIAWIKANTPEKRT